MVAYFLALTKDEIDALAYWQGRNCWATAAASNLRIPEDYSVFAGSYDSDETPNGPGLYFETEADAWEFREECEKDAEGGHSMFSGIKGSFAAKMHEFLDTIV